MLTFLIVVKRFELRVLDDGTEFGARAAINSRLCFAINKGAPVKSVTLGKLFRVEFVNQGLDVTISEMRHVLESIARKEGCCLAAAVSQNPLLRFANHAESTSNSVYGKGRGYDLPEIPADRMEECYRYSDHWNRRVLGSNASKSNEVRCANTICSLINDLITCKQASATQETVPCESMFPATMSQSLPVSVAQHCDSAATSQVTLSQRQTQRPRTNEYPADFVENQHMDSKRPRIEQDELDDGSAPTSNFLPTVTVIQSKEKTTVSPHDISTPLLEIPLPASLHVLAGVGNVRMRALGVTALRQGQEMMMNLLQQNANQHSLIVLPTGSGKTKVLLLDAMLRNVCNIVFVPFTSIAKELLSLDICEDGARLNVVSWASIRHDFSLSALNANVVVASFEHACQNMIPFLQCLQERGRLGFCFVDEVDVLLHTYRCFSQFWSLATACPLVKIKAMTATLRPRDKVRVEDMLGIRFDSEIRHTCRRDDIALSSRFYPNQVAVMKGLVGFVESMSKASKVLIFCMTIQEAESIGETLLTMFSQHVSISHSRRRDPLQRIAVVTSCYGHGVNVMGLSHVVVVRSAWSIEGFVQASSLNIVFNCKFVRRAVCLS